MARSVETIYNEMIIEKESLSSLDPLEPTGETYSGLLGSITSGSKTAIWRLVFYVVAYFAHLQEVLWDTFKAEVIDLVSKAKYGTLRWYVEISKQYQHGDVLTFTYNFPGYAVIDPTKRIVTQASAIDDPGANASIIVKVAKGTLVLEPLDAIELAAYTAYINQYKMAGIKVNVVSLNADQLQLSMIIGYDAIRPVADVQADVEEAIKSYLNSLPFDGRFRRLAFEDAIQQVEGVDTITIIGMVGLQGLVPELITQVYTAGAGYMEWDAVGSTISYTPV